MKMSYSSKAIPAVYAISITANLFLLYFLFMQFTGVTSLNDYWRNISTYNLTTATELAEIESNLGYVGFIHHFKNYIIRREDSYYIKAEQSYITTKAALNDLRALALSDQEIEYIETINITLERYYQNLMLAKRYDGRTSTTELDKLVKVDDSKAEKALAVLRGNILPKLKSQQEISDTLVQDLKRNTIKIVLVLLPLVILSSYFTITIVRRLAASNRQIQTIFETTPDTLLFADSGGNIIRANLSAVELFGYSIKELEQMQIEDLIESRLRTKHRALREDFMSREQTREITQRLAIHGRKKDGSLVDLNIAVASTLINDDMHCVCVIKDLTAHNQLKAAATKDHLTKLNNRRYFDEMLAKELSKSQRTKEPLTLLIVDLDNFKPLNDTHGHTAGDMALQNIAEFLKQHIRAYDHLARWGGDEFVLLCPGLSAKDSLTLGERIRSEFAEQDFPFEHRLTLSIGIASTHNDEIATAEQLLEAADKAVYAAKDAGRNLVKHFDNL